MLARYKNTLVFLTTFHLPIAVQHLLNFDAIKEHLKVRTQKTLPVHQ